MITHMFKIILKPESAGVNKVYYAESLRQTHKGKIRGDKAFYYDAIEFLDSTGKVKKVACDQIKDIIFINPGEQDAES